MTNPIRIKLYSEQQPTMTSPRFATVHSLAQFAIIAVPISRDGELMVDEARDFITDATMHAHARFVTEERHKSEIETAKQRVKTSCDEVLAAEQRRAYERAAELKGDLAAARAQRDALMAIVDEFAMHYPGDGAVKELYEKAKGFV